MEKKNGLKVVGHTGTWYVIAEAERHGRTLYLLEHEKYGDAAAHLIVDENLVIWMEFVYNGFDDFDELQDANLRKVGVFAPDFCDQKYIRDRDLELWSVSEEHARFQFIHHYKDSWLKSEEYKLVRVLEDEYDVCK